MKLKNSNIPIILFEILSISIIFLLIEAIISINHQRYTDETYTSKMSHMANELHQSSDDLTNFARSYAVTNDNTYKDKYFQILAIRNGVIARPKEYNSIYWDIDNNSNKNRHPESEKISFKDIVKKLPFTPFEIKLLVESEDNSNALVNIEVKAFNAMIGKFVDKDGAYTIKSQIDQKFAISLLHSKEYLIAKQTIMKPIDELITTLKSRRNKISDENHNEAHKLFMILIGTILIFIIGNIFIYIYLNKKEDKRQREIDSALAYSKAKSTFLANMSHEIRTPLNAILGFINLLKKEISSEAGLKQIKIIQDSSNGLLKIIEDILDLSKIESDKIEIDMIDFNLKEELELIINLFELRMSEANISMYLKVSPNMPQYIHADSLRIKQVIINLLGNALKFSPPHTTITIAASYENETLTLSVEDQGKGIAKEKQKQIFEAFSQEDVSTTREYGGTGLGLTISSRLIQLMGGELCIESQLGKGSRFYFSIHALKADKSDIINTTPEPSCFNGQKILLVEDNKSNQLLMKLLLEEVNLQYKIAENGQVAVDMFKEAKYDLILMDENMPVMNGRDAARQIILYEQKNALVHTPIVALTANALKGDREKFINAGMDDYLTKPIDVSLLQNVLNKFLN